MRSRQDELVTGVRRHEVRPALGAPDAGTAGQVPAAFSERLGIYVDDVLYVGREVGDRVLSTDCAFFLFASEVGDRFAATVLFGRTLDGGRGEHRLPASTDLVALPYYRDLHSVRQAARAVPGTVRGFWRGLDHVDIVWVFGPNPFAVVLAALGVVRRRRVVLGVRQDSFQYFRTRLGARRAAAALAVAWGLDRIWRGLARRLPVTVTGAELARAYSPRAHEMIVGLVRKHEIAGRPLEHDWSGEISLLTVGRLDVEKDPFLTVELLGRLEAMYPGRFRLVWLGSGPMETALRARIAALGLGGRIELRGYVPFGPRLLAFYRDAHALVHVSLTEGVPQSIVEALACGTPVVASSVGGIPAALEHGRAGLVVPPRDAEALAAAVVRLADDAGLRCRLAERGLALARRMALEDESERVARFLNGRRQQ
jgi:glycosyltransferase involved in cell wall biosynthesis